MSKLLIEFVGGSEDPEVREFPIVYENEYYVVYEDADCWKEPVSFRKDSITRSSAFRLIEDTDDLDEIIADWKHEAQKGHVAELERWLKEKQAILKEVQRNIFNLELNLAEAKKNIE